MYIGNDLRYGRSEVYYFTATSGGETSISTASDGRAIRYTVGFCTVYLNGIRLHDTDITVTSGTSVAFASALSLNDVVTVEATHPLSVANAVPIGGGAFTGAVTAPNLPTTTDIYAIRTDIPEPNFGQYENTRLSIGQKDMDKYIDWKDKKASSKKSDIYSKLFPSYMCYNPDPGKLVIFSSTLDHAVQQHNTDDLRITLAYNYT